MNLVEYAVTRSRFTFVVYGCLLLLGVVSFRAIPKLEDPDTNVPRFTIVATYPGANAGEIEQSVARPLEEALKELDDVDKISSTVKDGYALTKVAFFFGGDPDRKYDEVLRQAAMVRANLPEGVNEIEVRRSQTIDVAAVQIALVSPEASYGRLQDLAEALRKRLETVPEVRQVRKHAYPEKQVGVTVRMEQMVALGVSLGQVIAAIQGDNSSLSAGAAEVGNRRFNIKASGNYSDLAMVRRTTVLSRDGAVVRLGDIAEVRWETAEVESFGRYNGERAMFVSVRPRAQQNLFHLSEHVSAELERFRATMPADVRLEIGWDQSLNVGERLGQLRTDFLLALLLVAVTVLPLGFRASVLVMVSVPLSLAIGLTALHLTGFSLNQLSIVGGVIALGLLVDDSIVVVENVARFRRQGSSAMRAAIDGTLQILPAVIGTTLTLIFAFLPLLVIPGTAGQFIMSLPAAVIYTVVASMAVALTITPLLARYLFSGSHRTEANGLLRGLQKAISASYRPLLHFCMKHRLLSLGVTALLVVGGFALLPNIGFSLFPKAGLPQFLVQIEAEEGASVAATDVIVRQVEAILEEFPEITNRFTTVGDGNPRIYYNFGPQSAKANTAEMFATIAPYDRVKGPVMLERIRGRVKAIPGARIIVKEFENGSGGDAPIEVRLISDDLDDLTVAARQVEDMLGRISGIYAVKNPVRVPRTDLRVVVDATQASALGVAEADIDQAARFAFAGVEAGRFREADGDEYPIRLQLPREARATLENWPGLQVRSAVTGAYLPIAQVARLELESAPPVIERYNQERSVTVTALVAEGYNVARLTNAAREQLEVITWPAGMRWEFGGEAEEGTETFGGLGTAVLIAIFGILAILVIEFGSFRGTLIVASVIPLGFVGGLVALWITGYTLSFTAAVGFIALIGMEIKNSILLVDFTNDLRRQGVPLCEAIEQAGEVRFLPVVLTTFTALGALLPLALQGSGLYSPLAIVIMGGLISSLVLSRVVTPLLYSLMPPPSGQISYPENPCFG